MGALPDSSSRLDDAVAVPLDVVDIQHHQLHTVKHRVQGLAGAELRCLPRNPAQEESMPGAVL